jgi:hypothetical protein
MFQAGWYLYFFYMCNVFHLLVILFSMLCIFLSVASALLFLCRLYKFMATCVLSVASALLFLCLLYMYMATCVLSVASALLLLSLLYM